VIFRDIKKPESDGKESKSKALLIREKLAALKNNHSRGVVFVLVAACVVLFLITLVQLGNKGLRLKGDLTGAASDGYEKIVSAVFELKENHLKKAKDTFDEAFLTFGNIKNEAWFTAPRLPALTMKDPTFEAGSALINAGQYLSKAGSIFTEIAGEINIIPSSIFEANNQQLTSEQKSPPSLTEKLKKQIPRVLESVDNLNKANEAISGVPESFIPVNLRENFNFAKEALNTLVDSLKNLQDDLPAILALLGDKEPHTFLILLQNNAELRPTGGFIGNYMLAETNDGYLTKLNIFDVYSADHQLAEVIIPPEEILPVNNRWFLRDSNYSGHFPISAEKVAWFLEKEGGPGVDSVLTVDQSFLTELLRLTGPIKIPELKKPLTSENFTNIISYVVESKLSGKEDPKAILKDFLPAFESSLFKVDPIDLLPLLRSAIESKDVLAYSKNADVQGFFTRHEIAGVMKDIGKKEDYLNIVHTSVSANKSDTYVAETIKHDTYLKSNGGVTNELTITRTHQWTADTEKRIRDLIASFGLPGIPPENKDIIPILGGSKNTQMLRIYVPNGSKLEESSDPSVTTKFDKETGRTYFSAKIKVDPGEESSLRIRYSLPFKLNLDPIDKYYLYAQKQPGQKNITIIKRIFPPSGVMNYKYFPSSGSFDKDSVWSFSGAMEKDMVFSSVWGK
jgi:hypothetical protein